MTGRPSSYTPAIAEEILARLSEGELLRSICAAASMPSQSTVHRWARLDVEGFKQPFKEARDLGWMVIAEETISIADDTANDTLVTERGEQPNSEWIARSRLRVDARKWLLSKMHPRVFGDRVTQELTGPDGGPLQTQEIQTVVQYRLPENGRDSVPAECAITIS